MSGDVELEHAHHDRFTIDDKYWAYMVIGGAAVGIPSLLLASYIIQHPQLFAPCYTFLRFIIVMELCNMVCYVVGFFQWLYGDRMYETDIGSFYMIYIDTKFEHAFPLSVCLMISMMAFQRGVVAQSADHYSSFAATVNTIMFARISSLLAIAASAIIYIPSLFIYTFEYNSTAQRNVRFFSEHSRSLDIQLYADILDYIDGAEFCFILIGTMFTVLTLRRTLKQRNQFRSIRTQQARRLEDEVSIELVVCKLQIGETVLFLTASSILVVLKLLAKNTVFDETKILQMHPADARRNMEKIRAYTGLSVFLTAVQAGAHSTYLFWYLVFAPKVRRATKERFGCVNMGEEGCDQYELIEMNPQGAVEHQQQELQCGEEAEVQL